MADPAPAYEIRIRGRLTDTILQAFDGMGASFKSVETVLHGPLADQAALHELLDRVQALGLELVDVRRLPDSLPDRVRIVYVGHGTALIELDGVALLTDPLLRKRVAHLTRLYPVSAPVGIDAVLLSHLHPDHLDFRSLAKLPRSVPMVLPPARARSSPPHPAQRGGARRRR